MLGCIWFAAHQTEDPIGDVRRAGPNLLSVDYPLIAIQHGRGGQAGKVAARSGFGIPLAPHHIAMNRRANELLFLLLGTHF